jgi:D-alanine--poly(phosphoribitol) ligase subunit 1
MLGNGTGEPERRGDAMKVMKLVGDVLAAAAAKGNAPALTTGEEVLTWGRLGETARRAASLLEEELGPGETPAAVAWGSSPLALPLFLGCLMAGRPYLPLEASLPALRREEILRDSGAPLLLEPAGDGFRWTWLRDLPREEGAPAPGYLLYTSGSTGHPKGVEITGGNLDFFLGATRSLPREPEGKAVWLTHAPWSFDLSVLPLWQGLARGERVVHLDTSRGVDFPRLAREMSASGATVWVSTPSFARLWLRDPSFGAGLLPRLSLFFFCGETLDPALARELMERFPGARVVNAYGPTECTMAAAAVEISPEMAEAGKPLPVGRALPGVSLAALGEDGAPLPAGEEGEIAIGGPGVGRGYRNLPELTRERFFFRDGLPWYRTGDLGRLEDGLLWFSGRRDLQVKHRGCRVELEDLEQNLLALPEVAGAAAALQGDRLLALAVPRAGAPENPRVLLASLRERLPGYLIPARIFWTEAIPLTPQGKIDRRRVAELLAEKGGTRHG